jgi:hypothetical protein
MNVEQGKRFFLKKEAKTFGVGTVPAPPPYRLAHITKVFLLLFVHKK